MDEYSVRRIFRQTNVPLDQCSVDERALDESVVDESVVSHIAIYYINRFWFEDIMETISLICFFNLKSNLYFLSNVNIHYECFHINFS